MQKAIAAIKIILICFVFIASVALIALPWFDGYATLIMAGAHESAKLSATGNVSNPEIIKWSEIKVNTSGDTFTCYTPYFSTSDTTATYQVGTARKLFSTLTVYKIVNCDGCQVISGCIARGPRSLITFNFPIILFANACTMILSFTVVRLIGRGSTQRSHQDSPNDSLLPGEE